MLYLVTGVVLQVEYDYSEEKIFQHLVDADSKKQAERKFDEFYTTKSESYGTSYYTSDVVATETIL